MNIKLSREAVILLYRMFWQPSTLTQEAPYQSKDEQSQSEVVKITRWLAATVFTTTKTTDEKTGKPVENFDFGPFEGKVKQRYIDRMLLIHKHYEKSGMQINNSLSYVELCEGLTGKVTEIESVEEQ